MTALARARTRLLPGGRKHQAGLISQTPIVTVCQAAPVKLPGGDYPLVVSQFDRPNTSVSSDSRESHVPWRRGAAGLCAVTVLCSLFIASYVGALHRPSFRGVPVAASSSVVASIERIPGVRVVEVGSASDARKAIDERRAYGSVTPGSNNDLVLTVAEAASPAIAQELSEELRPKLAKETGADVELRIVYPLDADDSRGLVGFYAALGWVVAGYLGATVLALAFGDAPPARRTAARLVGVAALGLAMGMVGALIAREIGGLSNRTLGVAAVGALTTFAVGAATIALQGILGIVGTGAAILLFVVAGNPSAGGAATQELLPEPWRTVGPLLPNGAATTALRNLTYFPEASIIGPLLVLGVWAVAATALALVVGARRSGLDRREAAASLAAVG